MQRIVIRHINGSKANQVEEFPLQHFRELVLGREVNCAVKFDPNFDDLVSRQHARIVRDSANPEAFSITDLESRNGTMVNRQRVSGATRLQHGDVVQLGPGGPEFRFEVDPPPAQAMRETRLAQTETMRPAPPTREAVGMSTPPGMTGGPISDSQQKRPVGRATVERMLGDVTIKMQGESNKALTVGVVSLAAILVLGGGLWFYQRNQAAEAARSRDAFLAKQAEITQRMDDLGHNQDQVRQLEEDASALRAQLTKKYGTPAAGAKSPEAEELKKTVDAIADQKAQLEKAKAELDKKRAALAAESAKLPDQVKALVEEATKTSAVPVLPEYAGSFAPPVASGGPKTPEQIHAENLDSVVAVETAWKLLDTGTGRELYQNYAVVKRVCDGPAGGVLPVFRQVDGRILPDLTTQDGGGKNQPIGGVGSGTGFIATKDGFFLSNSHVLAPWKSRYEFRGNRGILIVGRKATCISGDEFPREWVPEQGGYVDDGFNVDHLKDVVPQIKGKSVEGRADYLDVIFPKTKQRIAARLVTPSDRHDVSLGKVDVPGFARPVSFVTNEEEIKTGMQLVVMGYPAVSGDVVSVTPSQNLFNHNSVVKTVADPTTNAGVLSKITPQGVAPGTIIVEPSRGDVYQLGINTTGQGNSGGPVFDMTGRVIGIFFASYSRDNVQVTFAVPVKYALELLSNAKIIN